MKLLLDVIREIATVRPRFQHSIADMAMHCAIDIPIQRYKYIRLILNFFAFFSLVSSNLFNLLLV